MITTKRIRDSLRISHNAMDDEIRRNIHTCLMDLKRIGVDKSKDDALIHKACELYCKWQFDYEGKGESYQKHYEQLRDSMGLTEEYRCTTNKSD